jgi:hypothetical protein
MSAPRFNLPTKSTALTAQRVHQGLRVELRGRNSRPRLGLLTGLIDKTYPRPRVEVIPEGLSLGRIETWALADCILLPRKRQLVPLGGSYQPPKGYPLINKEPGQSSRE